MADQAALHGLLKKVRDLGVTMISLTCIAPGATNPLDTTNPERK